MFDPKLLNIRKALQLKSIRYQIRPMDEYIRTWREEKWNNFYCAIEESIEAPLMELYEISEIFFTFKWLKGSKIELLSLFFSVTIQT